MYKFGVKRHTKSVHVWIQFDKLLYLHMRRKTRTENVRLRLRGIVGETDGDRVVCQMYRPEVKRSRRINIDGWGKVRDDRSGIVIGEVGDIGLWQQPTTNA